MKNIYLFFWLLLSSHMIFAQDTILYNSKNQVVNNWAETSYYKISSIDVSTNLIKVFKYDSLGVLEIITHYLNVDKKIKEGQETEFFDDGKVKKIVNYSNDKKEGEFKTFFRNGQLKRLELYKNGEFIKGTCYDSTGKKVKFFDFEIMPQFPDGQEAFYNYLSNNLKYPEEARMKDITGVVIVHFVIEKDGSIANISILKSVDELLDKEAIRVIQNMPKWIPGKIDGEPMKMTYDIPFNFSLKN